MSVTSNDKQQQSAEPRVWVVRAGRKGEAVQHNLEQGVVSIGWGQVGDQVESLVGQAEFKEDWEILAGESNGANQVWHFAKEIKVGDLVVMPQKRAKPEEQQFFAIGRVTGPYERHNSQPEQLRRHRKVEWLETNLAKDLLNDDLQRSLRSPTTVYQVRSEDAPYRIMYLVEHGEDPGARRDHDNDPTDIWKQRLEQYLDTQAWAANTIRSVRGVVRSWIDYALSHGHSPSAFDENLLERFLASRNNIVEKTRQEYTRKVGPARKCGFWGCWCRLGLCYQYCSGLEVGGVCEAVGCSS